MDQEKNRIRSIDAIAARLIATRKAIGLRQAEYAERAGIPNNTYNQYEQAKGRPSLDFALKLRDTYGLTLDWIYDGDPSGLPWRVAHKIFQDTPKEPSEPVGR
jgi:transcriptional regulator with XRE-family HTH domain